MPETLSRLFRRAISYDKSDAILTKQDGKYQPISSRELYRRVGKLHLALKQVGVSKGDSCALLSENRWEWAVTDFALMTAGAVSVPVYPTLSQEQILYLLEHSEARVIFVSSLEQLEKIQKIWDKLPNLEGAVVFDRAPKGDERIISVSKLIDDEPLTEAEIQEFETAMSRVEPDDLASLIYTSGTTGTPKGVMLSHRNFGSSVQDNPLQVTTHDVCLSFLPLSHVAERVADYIFFYGGATVAYAESMETVPKNMQEVRPTLALAVPRFFEKVHSKVMAAVSAGSPLRRRLFQWALEAGEEALQRRITGGSIPPLLRAKTGIADFLVLRKLRKRLGGRFRLFASGSAPLARQLVEFFSIVGVPVFEAYGLTESTAIISMNTPEDWKIGTVGKVLRNTEVRIADDGEILARGPAIMQGYYKNAEATREVLSEDGWFSTGDIGELDSDGFLSITDRKKDLFKTSGGKYIAPQPIENHLKTSPYVSMAVVVAEARKFPSALVIPDFDKLKQWAKANGVEFRNHTELVNDTRIKLFMEAEVQRTVEDLPRYEKPKKIILLDRELTMEDGEITPTMKVRRRAVEMKFARQIDGLYT